MSKNKCYLLTQSRLSSLIRHPRKGKDLSVCSVCHEKLRELDYVVRDGHNIVHSTCWPLFRYDSPDEVELEREVDSQLTQNQDMLSQRDLERLEKLRKSQASKESKIPILQSRC